MPDSFEVEIASVPKGFAQGDETTERSRMDYLVLVR